MLAVTDYRLIYVILGSMLCVETLVMAQSIITKA
jgi:hypothetical protein